MSTIVHLGQTYDLGRFDAHADQFSFVHAGETYRYNFTITYSTHCYSDAKITPSTGMHIFHDRGEQRPFCTERFARSGLLFEMVDSLFRRPTSTVGVLHRNYNYYKLQRPDGLYYMFFNLHRGAQFENTFEMRMYVESAYLRPNPVTSKSKEPFGRIVSRIALAG